MIKYSKQIIIVVGLMAFSMISLAQPSRSRRPPGPPRPQIPVDGGISILAAAGIAYGARKMYLFKKQEEADKFE